MLFQRKRKGSAITEFGPSLFIFLIAIFFPLMDVIGMAAVYCSGWYCNFLVTRELAVRRQQDEAAVYNEVNTEFMNTGLAQFVGVRSAADLAHSATYFPAAGGTPAQVTCTSRVTGKPFLTIPFIPAVPGLSAPVIFRMMSTRPREVTN